MIDEDNVLMEVEENGVVRYLYRNKRDNQPDAEIYSFKNSKIKVEDYRKVH
ncbi:MAG: hypothetical protein HY376_03305 [Candidatus Blackburnbacteria bacterium]|nr:hypothetical protein [Candidatus Blackburnbacteria bacterium]